VRYSSRIIKALGATMHFFDNTKTENFLILDSYAVQMLLRLGSAMHFANSKKN